MQEIDCNCGGPIEVASHFLLLIRRDCQIFIQIGRVPCNSFPFWSSFLCISAVCRKVIIVSPPPPPFHIPFHLFTCPITLRGMRSTRHSRHSRHCRYLNRPSTPQLSYLLHASDYNVHHLFRPNGRPVMPWSSSRPLVLHP